MRSIIKRTWVKYRSLRMLWQIVIGLVVFTAVASSFTGGGATTASGVVGVNAAAPTTVAPTTVAPTTAAPAAKPAPAPAAKPAPAPAPANQPTRYSTCKEAKAAGEGPYHRGSAQYGWYRDSDGDGVVCE